ncbi:MAG TPA: hypothetical protein VIH18_35905 [Candidatus Binatia bacterium]
MTLENETAIGIRSQFNHPDIGARGILLQRRKIPIGPGESPLGVQAQGEKTEAEQNRHGGYFFIQA